MSGTKFNSTWWQRTQQAVLIVAHVTGLIVIAAVVIYFAQQRSMRQEIDATKTRAYSLSQQTRQLLASLEGDWKIALVMVEDEADRALRRQTEEVLRRFTEASPKLTVLRLDPSDPRSVRGLEALIVDLRGIYGDLVAQYDAALDAGLVAFDELHLFSQQQAGVLQQLAQTLPAESPLHEALASRAQMLVLWSQQADSVREEVIKARRIDDRRPLPDYETARSILAGTLGHWAQELDDVTRMFDQWPHTPLPPAEVRDVVADSGRRFERLAQRLAGVGDPLRHLPPLELSDIARALQSGEAAIIAGPNRAAVVSSEALFPKSNVQQVAGGGVTFDRRFRGEQLIASTIRSLLTEHMPMVVFVHAEARSLLAPEERNVDLAGVASNLKAARFDVREWIVHRTERPTPADGQPVVWVPIPPPQRQGRDPSQEEQLLTDTAKQLIDEGASVLLSVYPSLRHRLRLPDAWADLALPFRLRVDTSAVLYEAVAVGEDERAIERGQTLTSYPLDHPISRAVEGQRSYFALPVAIELVEGDQGDVSREVLVQVEPGGERWLESRWNAPVEQIEPPPLERRLSAPLVIAVAAERPNPVERGTQRLVLVGSGGWMLSYLADVAENIGGERYALRYPANFEFMQAAIAWLAGREELIAPSPASQEVSRLVGITAAVRQRWMIISMALLPGAALLLGLGTWAWRRR